jgi:hypothetical protein
MDIAYIPMARGFIYLAAVLDWFTRRVLSSRVSITLEAGSDIKAVEDALARHGKPKIFNTDQGSQVTGAEFIKVLAAHENVFEKGRAHRLSRTADAAMVMRASTTDGSCSKSRARRRHFMIEGSVRSTTHRRRMTTKPFIQGMRLTISSVTLVLPLAHATRRPA